MCTWAYCPLRQGLGILYCIVKFPEADWVGYFQLRGKWESWLLEKSGGLRLGVGDLTAGVG